MLRKIIIISFLFVLCFTSVNLFARAGGGESFGGSGGGSEGGGGGGGGELIFLLIWLVIKYPCIGIPLLIIVILVFIFGKIKASGNITDRRLRKSTFVQNKYNLNKALAKIRSRDPAFSIEEFKNRVSQAFLEIQKAWSEQNIKKIRRFISDGVEERFSLQIMMQKEEGWRNAMENVQVQKIDLIAVESDENFDTIHFAITAKAKDYKVDLKSGKILKSSKVTGAFSEIWSFLRKPGVKTLKKKGLFEGNCPNCAAPLNITDAGKCEACGAQIRSGDYDWILSEITQEGEWEARNANIEIPGVSVIKLKDKNFSLQHIEDRASVIFYRYQQSLFTGSAVFLRKVTYSSNIERISKRIQVFDNGKKIRFFRFPAVGKVEVLWTKQEEEFDKIYVLVKWSGSLSTRDLKTKKVSVIGNRTIYSHVFTLIRKVEAISPEISLHSAHCPKCGAPETPGNTDKCSYCGTVLNDGSRAWVLSNIEEFVLWLQTNREQWSKARQRAKQSSTSKPIALIEALAVMMASDGVIDKKEMNLLIGFSGAHRINRAKVEEIVRRVKSGHGIWNIPEDPQQALPFLYALIDMALSDGRISSQEKKLLLNAAEIMNIDKEKLDKLIKDRQKSFINFVKKSSKIDNLEPPPPPLK